VIGELDCIVHHTRLGKYQGVTAKAGDINHLISSQHLVLPFHISTSKQISSSIKTSISSSFTYKSEAKKANL
jgi:hypothetical protein